MTRRVNNKRGKLGASTKYNKQLYRESQSYKFNKDHPWLNTKPATGYEKMQGRPSYWRKPKQKTGSAA